MRKIILLSILFAFISSLTLASEVNVFSARHYDSDIQLYEKFTAKTGIKVNVVSGKDKALQKRITEEGADSKADLYITADAGRLGAFDAKGMFQNSMSSAIKAAVPSNFRSKNWTGIAKRARIIYYSPERVNANDLNGMRYEDLANPKWNGRIVIRSSNNIYNQSLMASLIEENGTENALKWAKFVRKNMSRKPRGNDRDQARAVASGVADLALVNTYYIGLLANSSDKADREVSEKLNVFFPNQNGRGTHINVSGGGVVSSSRNKKEAIRFLEFLTESENQKIFSESNYEYPLDYNNTNNQLFLKWGKFKADDMNLSILGERNSDAVKLFDIAGWE